MSKVDLERCLEDLENRIDPAVEDALEAEWRAFIEHGTDGGLFRPRRPAPNPPAFTWPTVSVNEAIEDFDLMALQQYGGAAKMLETANGAAMAVRANYGTGIMPSFWGARLFVMDAELNTLPTTWPVGAETAAALPDAGIPTLDNGLGKQVFGMGRHFAEIAARYPKIGRYVHVYHPDTQGPMDICELLWGAELFLDLVDRGDEVHRLLAHICDTYEAVLDAWFALFPPRADLNVHWALWHRGTIMLRDDSAMNLSPAMFAEFIAPYNQRVLDHFGGGVDHFCGKGDHYIDQLCALRGLYGVNMSQPHLNDMEKIYRHTVDRGIPLLGFHASVAEAALAAGRDLRGRVHV